MGGTHVARRALEAEHRAVQRRALRAAVQQQLQFAQRAGAMTVELRRGPPAAPRTPAWRPRIRCPVRRL
jgi:hypothetical protein